MSYLDRKLAELKSPDGLNLQLTPEQEKLLRLEFADYAFSACIDSDIRDEAELICASAANEEEEEEDDSGNS